MDFAAASKIDKSSNSVKSKIIIALDVESATSARQIISEIGNNAGGYKIGLQLFTAAGASFVRELTDAGLKIFLDLKFHDIPNTVAKASVEAARLGVWMFNVHAAGGVEMMRKAVIETREACEREGLTQPKIIAVTVLTSSTQVVLSETGVENLVEQQVVKLAKLANQAGLDGVVASPLEIDLIRANIESNDFLIVTPGIRNNSENIKIGTNDDQKRVMTAHQAIEKGANYLVIGRPVTAAKNRLQALQNIFETIGG